MMMPQRRRLMQPYGSDPLGQQGPQKPPGQMAPPNPGSMLGAPVPPPDLPQQPMDPMAAMNPQNMGAYLSLQRRRLGA